jgi:hypothetical protein
MVQQATSDVQKWFTRTQLADELSISPQRVSELRTRGILVAKRNLYAADNIQRYQEYQDAYLVARKSTEPDEIIAQQVRLVRERANQNLIEYIRESRTLIDARVVRYHYAYFNAVIPEVFGRVAVKLAARIANIDEKPIIGEEIEHYSDVATRAIRRALNRFEINEDYELDIPQEILWPNTFDQEALSAARVEKVRFLANLQQLRTGRMRGRYHSTEAVEQETGTMFLTMKNRLRGMANSVTPQATNLSEREAMKLISEYFRKNVLKELKAYSADDFNSRSVEVVIADVIEENSIIDSEIEDQE